LDSDSERKFDASRIYQQRLVSKVMKMVTVTTVKILTVLDLMEAMADAD
jgi:hypothetical protein